MTFFFFQVFWRGVKSACLSNLGKLSVVVQLLKLLRPKWYIEKGKYVITFCDYTKKKPCFCLVPLLSKQEPQNPKFPFSNNLLVWDCTMSLLFNEFIFFLILTQRRSATILMPAALNSKEIRHDTDACCTKFSGMLKKECFFSSILWAWQLQLLLKDRFND